MSDPRQYHNLYHAATGAIPVLQLLPGRKLIDVCSAGSNTHLAPSTEHLPTSYPPSINDGRGLVDSYYEHGAPQSQHHDQQYQYPSTPQHEQQQNWDSRSLKSYATHQSQEHLNPQYEMSQVDHAPPVPHLQYQPDYPAAPPLQQAYGRGPTPATPGYGRPPMQNYPSSGGWSATREKFMRRRVRS